MSENGAHKLPKSRLYNDFTNRTTNTQNKSGKRHVIGSFINASSTALVIVEWKEYREGWNGKDVKGWGELSLCFFPLNWASRQEGVLGEWRYSPCILTSALDGGEWSASYSGRFNPRERALGTHSIGGWVGPRAGLDAVVKRQILSPYTDEVVF
jgi:hypothetical protein